MTYLGGEGTGYESVNKPLYIGWPGQTGLWVPSMSGRHRTSL